jgi:hypothetical protein
MDLLDKFNAGLPDRLHEDECWEWQGNKDKQGYGRISHNYKKVKVHRLAYEVHYAEPLGDLLCCHKCDNPSCVNPNHLYAGTNADNMRDKVERGRQHRPVVDYRGDKSPRSILKEHQVRDIRNLYKLGYTIRKLSGLYPAVKEAAIANIVHNRTWKHLLERE